MKKDPAPRVAPAFGVFKAQKEGQTALVIPIKRPWEKDSQTYLKVNILVRP